MSACAIAFLGGEYRFVSSQSEYGVHRFSLSGEGADHVDTAQRLSASIVEYIRTMQVDTELFSIASEIPSNDILILPKETLDRLNIVNNGFKKPKWSIESIPEGLYLKGERETIHGIQKYIITFPATGNMFLHVIFNGGRNAEDIMGMEADRLVVDDELIAAKEFRVSRVNDNGLINATYLLAPELLAKITQAKVVGLALQFAEDAPLFIGFDNLPFEEGSAKLPGLMALFKRGRQEDCSTVD